MILLAQKRRLSEPDMNCGSTLSWDSVSIGMEPKKSLETHQQIVIISTFLSGTKICHQIVHLISTVSATEIKTVV
jgi:hypothetical protein